MEKIIKILKAGKLVLAPTDTVWGIVCDATNPNAVGKVYNLKNDEIVHKMTCSKNDIFRCRTSIVRVLLSWVLYMIFGITHI